MAHRRDRLADAHEQIRQLKNRLHAFDIESVLPLRQRIAELERDLAALRGREDHSQRMHALYREAFEALLNLMQALASGKAST